MVQLFCDFDGTISINDTTDELLNRFALPEWTNIEEEWKIGVIGSAECMQRQIALIDATQYEMDCALDGQLIDPAFPAFVHFCESIDLPLIIISDGVDYFIRRILSRYHLQHLPLIANRLTVTGERSYSLSSSYTNPHCRCAAGVCKHKQLSFHAGTTLFIGDGRSDFCAAKQADIVFAKSTLAVYCAQQDIAYHAYDGFADILQSLRQLLPNIMRPQRTLPTYAFT